MAVRTIPTATLTQGYANQGWYNGRRATTVRQRCNLVHGSAFFALNYALPPRSRLVWAEVLTQTTVTCTGNDATNTASSVYSLVVHPATANATAALTQPQTATVSNPGGGTSGYMVLITPGLTTAVSNQTRGIPLLFGTSATNQVVNTNTAAAALITLQPASTSNSRLYASGTSGFVFGTSTAASTDTAGSVDVTLYIEEYDQAPYA